MLYIGMIQMMYKLLISHYDTENRLSCEKSEKFASKAQSNMNNVRH